MILAVAFALTAASYPPPPAEAERAVAARHYGEASRLVHASDFAVRLERCSPQESYEVQGGFGRIVLDAGHECVITISRSARPDYRVRGFFHFDGLDWRYYGPTSEPLVVETTSYGVDGGFSTATPKPGSTLYRGGTPGEARDPFARIFEGYDWFHEPAAPPPRDINFYTDQ